MKKILLSCLLVLVSGSVAEAESALCHSEIKPASIGELAYKERGDRCEGLFVQKVSATGLRIVAFHDHSAEYDDNSLALNISSPTSKLAKTLTVTSLRPKQYYRMDTNYAGMNFSMPLDLIRHPEINIAPKELAAVICASDCGSSTPTLVPALFGENAPSNPYVTLIANLELFELRIIIKDEATGEILHDKEMLGSHTWPAGKRADFPLHPYLDERDSVLFEVIATGRGNKLIDSISARLKTK